MKIFDEDNYTVSDEDNYTVSNGTVPSDDAFGDDKTTNLTAFWVMVGAMTWVIGDFIYHRWIYDRCRSVSNATRTQQPDGSNGAPSTMV